MNIKSLAWGLYFDIGQIILWAFLTYFGARPALIIGACCVCLILCAESLFRSQQKNGIVQSRQEFLTTRNTVLLAAQLLLIALIVLLWEKSHVAGVLAWVAHVFLMEAMHGRAIVNQRLERI